MNTAIAEITLIMKDFLVGLGANTPVVNLEKPVNFVFGDVATSVALKYAKQVGKNPLELADAMCEHLLAQNLPAIASVTVAKPGFINITFSPAFFSGVLAEVLSLQDAFGRNETLSGQKWVIEHTSPNPNKAMHLGHLRNNLVGMSLVRLLSFNGATVVSDAIDNNRGIAIAKMMWGFLAHMKKYEHTPTDVAHWMAHREEWLTPDEKGVLPDIFVTECYIAGETDFKSSPDIEQQVRGFVVSWENGDEAIWKLWAHVLSFAYAGMERTLTRLGNHWDKVWHEHEHYKSGKDYVQRGIASGIFKTLEDGAILTNLEDYHIPDTILLKNDGTSLYITQDIALTAQKKSFYTADKLVWVIGPDQSLAMKQLFAVCEQLGIGAVSDFTHVPYGYVGLRAEDGGFQKMSSRAGTVVLIDDVIDMVKGQIMERAAVEAAGDSKTRVAYSDELGEKLALAAVKFSILKSDRSLDLVFDTEQSIATTGDSGVYVMYTYTRTQSILRKKEWGGAFMTPSALGAEADVVRQLLYFPYIIRRSQEDLSVHHICQYLLELSAAFNSWYAKEIVLDGSDREDYKLAVTKAVGITIKNGFAILGIDVIEGM